MSYDRRPIQPTLQPEPSLIVEASVVEEASSPVEPKIVEASTGEEEEVDPNFGELQVAEYIVFLLALDTYMRYLEEAAGEQDVVDDMTKHGLRLLRMADTLHLGSIGAFLKENLPSDTHKKMLERALRLKPTADGAARRALQVRTLLSRGGTSTMRAVFQTNKALMAVRTAIAASMVDDADAALDKFAVIPMKNIKIRNWIDDAAKQAGSGLPPGAITTVNQGVSDDVKKILVEKMKQDGASITSNEGNDAGDSQDNILNRVQLEAETSAKKTMVRSGEEDSPPTKSEVVGIATAAAVAAISDPSNDQNVPASLRSLDAEQRAAALTDGRVLVAAGAGSGKTTTLTSRVAYLVQERKVPPSKIFVVSFNTKAAREIKERIASKIGDDLLNDMTVGTMHSIFKKFVVEYGTAEEKAALTTWLVSPSRGGKQDQRSLSRAPTPGAFTGYMSRLWKECFDEDPPGGTKNIVQGWMMNDISPDQAKAQAADKLEVAQAEWYRWTLGFKGVLKGWSPPCVNSNPKAGKAWGEFLAKWRDNGRARLGDFSDMIILFRDLLKRDPNVRKKLQSMFDHVLVDEAQDLNTVQHQIVAMLTEHVGDGSDGKSVWIVGDADQSINAFVGARPELFAQFHDKEGWKTKTIGTNYRCLPEIVSAASTLLSHHPEKMPRAIKADPTKPVGAASIVVQEPSSHATGAIGVVSQISQDVATGAPLSDYAVLSRTNMELNDYETACIIASVPYARKGGTSFLRSPETITVMSYVNLIVGNDFARMQMSLVEVLNKPNRFFLRAGEAERIIGEAVNSLARNRRSEDKAVNPLDLFTDEGIDYILRAMDPQRRNPSWKTDKDREQLQMLGDALYNMRSMVDKGGTVDRDGKTNPYTTQKMFGDILAITGVGERGKPAPTLRDTLMPSVGGHEEEGDAPPDPDDDPSKKPLGNVEFLFQIAQPDPANPEIDPSDPRKFKAKIDKFVQGSKDLRVNLDEWDSEQQKLPEGQRQKPPCVVLSTVHSVKGAQWNNTTVVMAKGIFPYQPKKKPSEDTMSPEAAERLAKKREEDLLTERQLAYVAMTRAAKSLTIMCPRVTAYGRKDGGLSPFVAEAGLRVGQNVPGKNDPDIQEEDTRVVMARFMGVSSEVPPQEEPSSYDRRAQ